MEQNACTCLSYLLKFYLVTDVKNVYRLIKKVVFGSACINVVDTSQDTVSKVMIAKCNSFCSISNHFYNMIIWSCHFFNVHLLMFPKWFKIGIEHLTWNFLKILGRIQKRIIFSGFVGKMRFNVIHVLTGSDSFLKIFSVNLWHSKNPANKISYF